MEILLLALIVPVLALAYVAIRHSRIRRLRNAEVYSNKY